MREPILNCSADRWEAKQAWRICESWAKNQFKSTRKSMEKLSVVFPRRYLQGKCQGIQVLSVKVPHAQRVRFLSREKKSIRGATQETNYRSPRRRVYNVFQIDLGSRWHPIPKPDQPLLARLCRFSPQAGFELEVGILDICCFPKTIHVDPIEFHRIFSGSGLQWEVL